MPRWPPARSIEHVVGVAPLKTPEWETPTSIRRRNSRGQDGVLAAQCEYHDRSTAPSLFVAAAALLVSSTAIVAEIPPPDYPQSETVHRRRPRDVGPAMRLGQSAVHQ